MARTTLAIFFCMLLSSAGLAADLYLHSQFAPQPHVAVVGPNGSGILPESRAYGPTPGGTEATAFNPRAVAAMRRAGFSVEPVSDGNNPLYQARYGAQQEPMAAFSKVYFDEANPQEDFCAVMTCSQADESCPIVKGASYRVSVPYDDPKAFDGTELESEKYDQRCRQISREMLYLFSQVKAWERGLPALDEGKMPLLH